MSDSYEALVDCNASPDEARALAPSIVRLLSERRLIIPEVSPDCVFDGMGYPAGPGCPEAYKAVALDSAIHANGFWTLRASGVEVHCEPWVNLFGFTMFDGASCPRCGSPRDDGFLHDVAASVEAFTTSGSVPSISCPACSSAVPLHEWDCDPHLGFVNLAVVFWNWAPFDDANWSVDIPALLERDLKRTLVRTHGHM